MIRLKICGMRDAQNIGEVSALGPDFIGFIFFPGSPRFVGDKVELPATVNVKRVGVFVNETVPLILEKAVRHDLHLIQLHGDESPEVCAQLKSHNLQVIKAFRVSDTIDFTPASAYSQAVDYFLFDTQGRTEEYGGTGKTFNWRLLDRYTLGKPFFLSGGIKLSDIPEIQRLRIPELYAIDVNSGVEVSPGVKNPADIAVMIKKLNDTI